MRITTSSHLPYQPATPLVGRDDLLSQAGALLSDGRAVLLYGVPGVGKRAIAAGLAATALERGQEVLWLRGDNLSGQLSRLYGGLTDNSALIGRLRDARPLLVLEDTPEAADFLWHYGRSLPALVIQESASDGPWEPLLVRRLTPNASRQLYENLSGRPLSGEDERLLVYLDGHPLALRLLALGRGDASYRDFPFDDTATPQRRVEAAIEAALRRLDRAHEGLLMVMSASFSDSLSADLLGRMLNAPEHQVERLMLPLRERGFITQVQGRYGLHPLIRTQLEESLRQGRRFDEAQRRLLNALIPLLQENILPADKPIQWAALDRELEQVIGAAGYAASTGQSDALARLIRPLLSLESTLTNRGYGAEVARLKSLRGDLPENEGTEQLKPLDFPPHDTQPRRPAGFEQFAPPDSPFAPPVAGASDAVQSKPPTQESALVRVDPNGRAVIPHNALQNALNNAIARHDRPEMARLSLEMGLWFQDNDQHEIALEHFQQAIALYQETGDLPRLLEALELAATLSYQIEGGEKGLTYILRGLNIAGHLRDSEARGRFLTLRGDIYTTSGHTEEALESYKRAIKIFRALDDPELSGVTLSKLANLYMDVERYREATMAFSQAISLFEEAGRRDLQGRALGNLGTALGFLGRWHEAGRRHAAALKIARDLGDRDEERFQLLNLAYVAETEGHLNWAIHYNRQALYLALLDNDRTAVSEIAYELGRLLLSQENGVAQAVILLEKADGLLPRPEVMRLLRQARARLEGLPASAQTAERDLLAYAAAVYPRT